MPEDKNRRRMVVEEVGVSAETSNEEPVSSESISTEPVEEIKEKVEELQTLTQDISQSVERSVEVQEDIAKAAEEVVSQEPVERQQPMQAPVVPQIKNSNSVNPLLIILPGIFLLGALLGGIYFYQKSMTGTAPEQTSAPDYSNSVTPSPTSTPAPTAKADLTKYPINVMNGSGTPGLAGTVKELLTGAGFKVSATGNAPSYDFTKTVIKAKADVPQEFITKLSETLSKSYVVDTNQALATSSADSVQVIIGSTKAK
jgi:hypothetical protein